MRGFAGDEDFITVGTYGHINRCLVAWCLRDFGQLGWMGDFFNGLVKIKRLIVCIFVTSKAGLSRHFLEPGGLGCTGIGHYRFRIIIAARTVAGLAPDAFVQGMKFHCILFKLMISGSVTFETLGAILGITFKVLSTRNFIRLIGRQHSIRAGVCAHPPFAELITTCRAFVTVGAGDSPYVFMFGPIGGRSIRQLRPGSETEVSGGRMSNLGHGLLGIKSGQVVHGDVRAFHLVTTHTIGHSRHNQPRLCRCLAIGHNICVHVLASPAMAPLALNTVKGRERLVLLPILGVSTGCVTPQTRG